MIERPAPLTPRQGAGALGLHDRELNWFAGHGLDIGQNGEGVHNFALLLIGHAAELDEDKWRGIFSRGRPGGNGGSAQPVGADRSGRYLCDAPVGDADSCTSFRDWLYHKECFATGPDLVASSAGPGLMDWRRFGPVLPRHLLQGDASTVAAFAAAIGFPCPGGYASGLLAASFRQGAGRVVVSTFDLLANLGSPGADQLTANLLRYANR